MRWLALAAWLIASTVLGGALLIRHLVALPTPPASDVVLRETIKTKLPVQAWRAVHFMYRECTCSRRTIDHLVSAPRPAGLHELAVVVDDHGAPGPEDARLRAAGIAVVVVTPEMLHQLYHLEAAPVLAVMTPEDDVAYIGGYNRHKQSAAYEDLAIIAELRAHHAAKALPVFGCAISDRLSRALRI